MVPKGQGIHPLVHLCPAKSRALTGTRGCSASCAGGHRSLQLHGLIELMFLSSQGEIDREVQLCYFQEEVFVSR